MEPKTFEIDGFYQTNNDFMFDTQTYVLSCGHRVTMRDTERPTFCPECKLEVN